MSTRFSRRLAFGLFSGLLVTVSALGQTPPIRMMPLGDSITYGSGAAGGYRDPLYRLFTNRNYGMDAFTPCLARIGVPTTASKAFFQQGVSNLEVKSNVPAVTNGTVMAGNLELWPINYSATNAAGVAGASNTAYASATELTRATTAPCRFTTPPSATPVSP